MGVHRADPVIALVQRLFIGWMRRMPPSADLRARRREHKQDIGLHRALVRNGGGRRFV